MKKVFILGGTGLLGYHTTHEFLNNGYNVKMMALPPMPVDDLFPEEVEITLGDMNELTDEEIIDMLSDCYAFVYAAGADERIVPDAPAMKFFYEANVLPTQRIARLAAKAGVKKFVLYNSYFAEAAEVMTELNLKDQAYPNTRLLQEQVAFHEGEGKMDVMSLRLPYIFGTIPGRVPLWSMFQSQIIGKNQWVSLKGSTSSVTVEQVGEATRGAVENGEHRGRYAINMYTLSHEEFGHLLIESLGQEELTKLLVLDYDHVKASYEQIDEQTKAAGKEHGIHMVLSGQLLASDVVTDPSVTKDILKIKEHDVVKTIRETLRVAAASLAE